MSEMALKRIAEAKAKKSQRLVLRNCKIGTVLPKELSELVWLEILDLEGNDLGNPSALKPLESLPRLRKLYIRGTNVIDISWIEKLEKLETLDLSGTPLINVESLAKLKDLKTLYLSRTKIKDIGVLSQLHKLKELNFSSTEISDLSALSGLRNLEKMNFSQTLVSDLKPLSELIRNGIQVKMVGDPHSTNWIFLRGCPLTSPPLEIASQGNDAILKYWEDLKLGQKFERHINRDVKLILVGNSRAGKSTLAHFLTKGELIDGHPSTHGMKTLIWTPDFQIERLKSEQNPEGKCHVKILDFGGQEYYHDTHHLFFNDNTAYILLWDQSGNKLGEVVSEPKSLQKANQPNAAFQNYPLQYWLDAVDYHKSAFDTSDFFNEDTLEENEDEEDDFDIQEEEYTEKNVAPSAFKDWESFLIDWQNWNEASFPSAPVLIVQNRIDRDGIQFLPQNQLKQWFNFIYDFTSVSLSKENPRRLKQLLLYIEELLGKMHIVGSELPIQYAWVKESIESHVSPIDQMSVMQFLDWANQEILKKNEDRTLQIDEQGADVLLRYLANIGLILFYHRDPILSDVVFLRPDRVLDGIYSIFEDIQVLNGRFDDSYAIKKLKKSGIAPTTLLLLMRQFKIIFLEGGQAGKYVAPLYLNPKPIQGVQLFLDLFQKPVYRIQYEAFIHKSVVLHFFEVFGPRAYREETLGGQELYYYWRNGIVIKDEHSDARVLVQFFIGEEDTERLEGFVPAHIDIFLLGAAESSSFLKDVLDTMETINKGWNTTVMVTHNGEDFVPLEEVEKAAAEKQFTFFYEEQIFQLIDFRKFITLKMPMKKVFISYSKTDAEFLQQLENHLAVFKRNGHIATWTDRRLSPGEEWDGKIKKELEEADIIIFLISADFLSTDYVWDIEMNTAIARDADGKAKVVPIVVRPCVWKDTPLWKFYSLEKATPIAMAENRDAAWERVVMDLERIMVAGAEGGGL